MLDHTRSNLDQTLSECRELGRGEWTGRRDRAAHAMHQLEMSPDWRRSNDENNAANDINSLLRKISAGAVHEIDSLIGELKVTRERLVIEAERVHREIDDYAALSRSAKHATKIIVESLNHSKQVADSPSIAEGANEDPPYPQVVAETRARIKAK